MFIILKNYKLNFFGHFQISRQIVSELCVCACVCIFCMVQFVTWENVANQSQRMTNINNNFLSKWKLWEYIHILYYWVYTLYKHIIGVVRQTDSVCVCVCACMCWIYSRHEAYKINMKTFWLKHEFYFGFFSLSIYPRKTPHYTHTYIYIYCVFEMALP